MNDDTPPVFIIRKSPLQVFSRAVSHIAIARSIINDIERAEGHHPNRKTSYVLRSYVVYLVALWQQFIRDTGNSSIRFICEKESRESDIEGLAADFEKEVWSKNFTTSRQITTAIKHATGITGVMNSCCWDGYSTDQVKDSIAALGKARNDIAHEAYTDQPVSLEVNLTSMAVLYATGACINNIINDEFLKRYQEAPFSKADPLEAFRQLDGS